MSKTKEQMIAEFQAHVRRLNQGREYEAAVVQKQAMRVISGLGPNQIALGVATFMTGN